MPVGVLIIMMIVVPIGLAAFFGIVEMRRRGSLVFRCARCGRDFQQASHLAFPAACPLCGASDWNRT